MNFVPLGLGPVNAVICCNFDRSRFSYVEIQVIYVVQLNTLSLTR